MAVIAQRSFSAGPVLLILLRFVLGAVPVVGLAWFGVQGMESFGTDPRFATEAPLDYFEARQAFDTAFGTAAGMAVPMAALVFILKTLLDAGAARFLALRTGGAGGASVVTITHEGWGWFWAYIRLAIPFLVLVAVGVRASTSIVPMLMPDGFPTLFDSQVRAQAYGLSITGVWVLIVANFALWSKAHLALAGTRRAMLGAFPAGIAGALRNPVSSFLTFLLLPLPTLAGAGLIGWLRYTETGGLDAAGYAGVGIFIALAQALIWYVTLSIAIGRRAGQLG